MKFSNKMMRVDLDCFVCEVLEFILFNFRVEFRFGEEEMRYLFVVSVYFIVMGDWL